MGKKRSKKVLEKDIREADFVDVSCNSNGLVGMLCKSMFSLLCINSGISIDSIAMHKDCNNNVALSLSKPIVARIHHLVQMKII